MQQTQLNIMSLSLLLRRSRRAILQCRQLSDDFRLDPTVETALQRTALTGEHYVSGRSQPGSRRLGTVCLPERAKAAVGKAFEVYGITQHDVKDEAWAIHRTIEEQREESDWVRNKLEQKRQKKQQKSLDERNLKDSSVFSSESPKDKKNRKKRIKKKSTIVINDTRSRLAYLLARLAPNFAAVSRVFREITAISPRYQPRSMLDFGFGLGSATLACEETFNKPSCSYTLVETQEGAREFGRQFLRSAIDAEIAAVHESLDQLNASEQFDLVVCAHGLNDLSGSGNDRIELISRLWKHTRHFLVLIDIGSMSHYELLMKLRNEVLRHRDGYTFAPCQHDLDCPLPQKEACYTLVNTLNQFECAPRSQPTQETVSYVIMRKGIKEENMKRITEENNMQDLQQQNQRSWPRIVSDVMRKHRHSHCDLCTVHGELQRVCISRSKHGALLRVANSCRRGDILPALPRSAEEIPLKRMMRQLKKTR